jgi:hypothetical protein
VLECTRSSREPGSSQTFGGGTLSFGLFSRVAIFFAEDPGLMEEKVDWSAPFLPRNPEFPRSFRVIAGPAGTDVRLTPAAPPVT